MLKQLVLLLALLAARPLAAQTPAALGTVAADSGAVLVLNHWYLPAYHPTARSGADSTGALLALFRKRRFAGWLYAVPFVVGMSLALPISSTDQYGQQHVADEAISPPLGVAVLAGTLVGFIAHATKFNKAHLLAIDRAYAAGRPIPAAYRTLLKPVHFAEAAYLRQAIGQQQALEQRGAVR